jgi:hypothetical protein
MGMFKVRMSEEFLVSLFAEGSEKRACKVIKGIPGDSRLIQSRVGYVPQVKTESEDPHHEGDKYIEFEFRSSEIPSYLAEPLEVVVQDIEKKGGMS